MGSWRCLQKENIVIDRSRNELPIAPVIIERVCLRYFTNLRIMRRLRTYTSLLIFLVCSCSKTVTEPDYTHGITGRFSGTWVFHSYARANLNIDTVWST